MKVFLNKSWQLIALLVVISQLAWAAAVSVDGISVAYFKQIRFAVEKLEKPWNAAPFTQAAIVQYSKGAVTYSSSNPAVASVDSQSGLVTPRTSGVITITANQAADGGFPAGSASYILDLSKLAPTIQRWNDINKTYGDAVFDLTAPISDGDGAFSYAISNEKNVASAVVPPGSIATVDNAGKVTIRGAGSATITATQAATAKYSSAQTTATLNVAQVTPQLSGLAANNSKKFGESFQVTVSSTITGPNAGAISYASSNPAVATIDSTTGQVTMTGLGNTTLSATQAATANYAQAQITGILTVNIGDQSLTGLSDQSKVFGSGSFNVTATSNVVGGGAISYAISEEKDAGGVSVATGTIATINSNTGMVTINAVGSAKITATQAATANYASASTNANLTVTPATPNLSWIAPITKTYGDGAFNLSVPPTSNSAGAFSYTSLTPAVATVAGNTVTIVGAGTATLRATQAASGNYASGTVDVTLTVNRASPSLSWSAINGKKYGDPAFDLIGPLAPTSNSSGAFSYSSSDPTIASISGSTVTILKPGTVTLTANQAESNNYTTGTTTTTLTVGKGTQTLTWENNINSLSKHYVNGGKFTVKANSNITNGGGTIAYSIDGGNASVASIDPNTGEITMNGLGTVTVRAQQAANNNYDAATDITLSLTVKNKTATTITAPYCLYPNPVTKIKESSSCVIGHSPLPVTVNFDNFNDLELTQPLSNSGGAFKYYSSDPTRAEISNPDLRQAVWKTYGAITITIKQLENDTHQEGSVSLLYEVSPPGSCSGC